MIFIYNTTAVIVFSGGLWDVSKLSDVLRYDPATDQWVKTGDLDTPRYWHRASAVNWVDIETFCIAASPPGAGCWSQSEGVIGQCTTGTECLPWLPDLGSWDGASAKYCLHSPPLAEGDSCDYDQKLGPCGAGLFCDEGLCQGAKPSSKVN